MVHVKLDWIIIATTLFFATIAFPSVPLHLNQTPFAGVVYAQGTVPISGGFVFASGPTGSGSAVTDSSGRYQIADGLDTGTYSLTVIMAKGYLDAQVDKIPVVAGKETSGINLSLKRSGAISGRVTGQGGNSLKGIIVYATQTKGTGGNSSSYAVTGADGSYVIYAGLSTGTYNVTAGFALGISGETVGYISKTTSGINVVGVQEIPNVNFQLDLSGSISGKVTTTGGNPLANVMVSASSSDYQYYGIAYTDSSGYYKITSGLATGTYMVVALKGTIPSIMPNVAVTAGQETPNINFQISITPSGSISGRVTDTTSGNAIEDASVHASGTGGFGSAMTDANGNYIISEGLATGDYAVYASASGYNSSSPKTVSVTVNQETKGVNFQLQKIAGVFSGKISGQITGESNPIPEFLTSAVPIVFSFVTLVALLASLRIRRIKMKRA